jgi:8-oxo-dGTP pyrophosphatase MutT (NUDIX family)
MWTLTPLGFYSVVQKKGDTHLTIRARVRADLDALRATYLPTLGATVAHAGTDYPFRATCTHAEWAAALAGMASDIDYANFKTAVAERQGYARAHVYGEVWSALTKLEGLPVERPPALRTTARPPAPRTPAPTHHASGKRMAYGGIVARDDGKLLMRLVAGRYDGEGWTWAKGKPDPGETAEEAAQREVLEETGCHAEIVARLPGEHPARTSVNVYFVMRPTADTGRFHDETEAIGWFTPEECRERIHALTTKPEAVSRDLGALEDYLAWVRG